MESEEIDKNISDVWEGTLRAITFVRDAFQEEFALCDGKYSSGTAVMKNLTLYLSERSQAVCFLSQGNYLWDAEIVLRSFYECAARIWFLGFQSSENREQLATEFLVDLDYSHNRKGSQKAAYASVLARRYGHEGEERIYEALQQEMVSPTGSSNKTARKAVESRWSFYEILDTLGRNPEIRIVELKSLLHIYGMMSHLIHADQKAIDLIIDEKMRHPSETKLLRAAHFTRIMNDLISIWTFSHASFRFAVGRVPIVPEGIKRNWETATEIGNSITSRFHDSQKAFYDNLLGAKEAK